jgi:putative colanic acid biosynthesis glycosyltransferase
MLISVVTVVYNGFDSLEMTIKSILSQTYQNIEYIIIDGNSTDATLAIIKKYENQIDTWISEADDGIYDAMNKGVKLANGDFIIFMNSSDTFYDDTTLQNIIDKINDKDKVYFGRAKITHQNTSWLYPNEKFDFSSIDIWLKKALPNHQAMLFPKSFYKSYSYDLKYKIGSDSDYKFNAQSICGFVFLDIVFCKFELGGVSSDFTTWRDTKQILHDSWAISMKHRGIYFACERFFRIVTKYLIKKVLSDLSFFKMHKRLKG